MIGKWKFQTHLFSAVQLAGSATLVHTLIQQDLVDELRLMIYPVVLGSGKRLFKEADDKKVLKLVNIKELSSGIFILIYQPNGK